MILRRAPSSGLLCHMALVRTYVSEEHIAHVIRMTRIGELRTALAVMTVFLHSMLLLLVTANVAPSSPILVTLMMWAIRSSDISVLTRATRRNNPEYGNVHSHRCENLNSYMDEFKFKRRARHEA
jgi:hypothetical protein